MSRTGWFKIIVTLQAVILIALVLQEQQRRTIWDKEAVSAQQVADIRLFSERTEANYHYVSAQLTDVKDRLVLLQIEAQKNANVAALVKDSNDRILILQEALNKTGGK
jgi:hypothetical protein